MDLTFGRLSRHYLWFKIMEYMQSIFKQHVVIQKINTFVRGKFSLHRHFSHLALEKQIYDITCIFGRSKQDHTKKVDILHSMYKEKSCTAIHN